LKLRPDVLVNLVFGRVGVRDPSVVVGPAIGEDSAIIDLGGFYLVVHSDPITGAVAVLAGFPSTLPVMMLLLEVLGLGGSSQLSYYLRVHLWIS